MAYQTASSFNLSLNNLKQIIGFKLSRKVKSHWETQNKWEKSQITLDHCIVKEIYKQLNLRHRLLRICHCFYKTGIHIRP